MINNSNTRTLSQAQLNNLEMAIKQNAGGVWEKALNRPELLAFHFEEAKAREAIKFPIKTMPQEKSRLPF